MTRGGVERDKHKVKKGGGIIIQNEMLKTEERIQRGTPRENDSVGMSLGHLGTVGGSALMPKGSSRRIKGNQQEPFCRIPEDSQADARSMHEWPS